MLFSSDFKQKELENKLFPSKFMLTSNKPGIFVYFLQQKREDEHIEISLSNLLLRSKSPPKVPKIQKRKEPQSLNQLGLLYSCHIFVLGAQWGTRTLNQLVRSQLLYPIELIARINLWYISILTLN